MIPVTVVLVTSNVVSQVKTKKKDGYDACQLAFQECRSKVLSKSESGHLSKNNIVSYKHLQEIRGMTGFSVRSKVDSSIFKEKDKIKVTGISKGKGSQGVIKRHNFARGAMSHGGGYPHRLVGSIGGGRSTGHGIRKGRKMPGRMGNSQVSVKGLSIEKILTLENSKDQVILIRGAVPGNNRGIVKLCK